jgi:hypothetical protein
MVVVGHVDRLDPLVAELADVPAHRDALEGGPGLLLHDECGYPFDGAGGQGHERGPLTVGHPCLGTGDDVHVPVTGGATRHVAGVAAGVRLRQGEGAPPLATGHGRQPTLPLGVVAVLEEQGRRHRVRVHDAGQAHPSIGEFLDDPDIGEEVETQAAVGRRDGDPEEAEVAHLLDDLGREPIRPFEIGHRRQDILHDEGPDRVDDLLANPGVGGRGFGGRAGHREHYTLIC